jgi:DNA-binding HxlR family transcriptional regulator
MPKPRHSNYNYSPGCAVEATITLIDGKWKCVILYHLLDGTLRFNQLRRLIPAATQRVLTAQLRELEVDGLVTRIIYAEVPPKVEYLLSDLGHSLAPVLHSLGAWGQDHMHLFNNQTNPEIEAHQAPPLQAI